MRPVPFSLEATSKTVDELVSAAGLMPPNVPVNVAWLDTDTEEGREGTVHSLARAGLLPVPIIAARRIQSQDHLFDLTERFRAAGARDQFMVVGGDPSKPAGPYSTASDLLATDWVSRFAIETVVLPGFPEGNVATGYGTDIPNLTRKVRVLESQGCTVEITTQLAFEPDTILDWIDQLRTLGVHNLIRLGIPGPTGRDRLIRFSRSFGVCVENLDAISTTVDVTIEFDRLVEITRCGTARRDLGNIETHLYPFGGTRPAVEWFGSRP